MDAGGGPFKNVSKTPLVLGQWVKAAAGSKNKVELVIVNNQAAPSIPTGGTLKLIYWQAAVHLNPHFAGGTKDQDASRIFYEPLAGYADGNHTTALERWLTGYVNGSAGFFTRINLGLADRYAAAVADGRVLLPPFVMGGAAMARGLGVYAPHRPPVLSGGSFDRFAATASGAIPEWARPMVTGTDLRMRDRQHTQQREHGALITKSTRNDARGCRIGHERRGDRIHHALDGLK